MQTLGIYLAIPCHLKISKDRKRVIESNNLNRFSLISDMVYHGRFHNFL